MKMTRAHWQRINDRFAEAARECGILWLTFSLLDRLVSGTFTFPWGLTNATGSLAVWLVGIYIELRSS